MSSVRNDIWKRISSDELVRSKVLDRVNDQVFNPDEVSTFSPPRDVCGVEYICGGHDACGGSIPEVEPLSYECIRDYIVVKGGTKPYKAYDLTSSPPRQINPDLVHCVLPIVPCQKARINVAWQDVCGLTITYERVSEFEPDPLEIQVSDYPAVGGYVTATGGTLPYTFSASGSASVNPQTGEILSTGCGIITFTVVDYCGEGASKRARSGSGVWVTTAYGDDGQSMSGCNGGTTVCGSTVYTGGGPIWWQGDPCCTTYCGPGAEFGGNYESYNDTGMVTTETIDKRETKRSITTTGLVFSYGWGGTITGQAGGHVTATVLGTICNGLNLLTYDMEWKQYVTEEWWCTPTTRGY